MPRTQETMEPREGLTREAECTLYLGFDSMRLDNLKKALSSKNWCLKVFTVFWKLLNNIF